MIKIKLDKMPIKLKFLVIGSELIINNQLSNEEVKAITNDYKNHKNDLVYKIDNLKIKTSWAYRVKNDEC